VGRIQRTSITYTAIIDGKLLTVPNFPVWRCDVCNAYVYDPIAVNQLQASLSAHQHALQEHKPHRSAHKAAAS
jgi:YgiT-type zinc finger domain-containing protein